MDPPERVPGNALVDAEVVCSPHPPGIIRGSNRETVGLNTPDLLPLISGSVSLSTCHPES